MFEPSLGMAGFNLFAVAKVMFKVNYCFFKDLKFILKLLARGYPWLVISIAEFWFQIVKP